MKARVAPRAFAALVMASAAAGAAPAEPALTSEQARGQTLFRASCIYCHGPTGFGTRTLERRVGEDRALLEQRGDLNAEYIKLVVRRGLNSMPWYRRTELSDAELQAVAAYLTRAAPHAAAEAGE